MNRLRQFKFQAVSRRQWMAGALLALFLSVFALILSETLHRALHDEACEPSHQCAVTMLQSGQVEMPVVTITLVFTTVVAFVSLPVENKFVPSVDLALPPSCGPPALLS